MTLDPLTEKGIPLDRQIRNWRELDVAQMAPEPPDPYTRCRVIALNGIECESIMFNHQLARHCPGVEVQRQLAEVR
jgi:hypothetical protein